MSRSLALLLLGLALLSGGAGAAASDAGLQAWAAAARKQHGLAGQVYDVRRGELADLAAGAAVRLPGGIVLLGEVHDNPEHHRLRALLIAQEVRARPLWRPAVLFEQIDTRQEEALGRFRALAEGARHPPEVSSFLQLLQWDKSGWPSKPYEPLLDAVIGARLPILAGSPPRDRVRELARGGAAAVSAEERASLRLDAVMPTPLAEAMDRELAESHCGALPPQAIPGMALAQRYRDAHMAEGLVRAASRHGSAILIAGNGHVRRDRGVPWHIRQRQPDAQVLSIALVEVEEGGMDPARYLPRDPQGNPAVDLVIFTPRAERSDPCAGLRQDKG